MNFTLAFASADGTGATPSLESSNAVNSTLTSSAPHALHAQLFGTPHLSWRGAPLNCSSQKGRALLYLLALRPEGVARDELAELFWGVGKYANLRQALYQLRRLPGSAQWLHVEGNGGEWVRVDVRSDVGAFEEAVQARRYGEALALSGAPLLAGVRAPSVPAWDDWLGQRRGLIGEQRRAALRGEAARLEGTGDLSGAIELTRTLTRLDPLDETSYRAAMRLHYRQGELEEARACFAECRHVMMRELGVEPLSETLELAHLVEKSRAHALTPRVTLPLQLLRPPHLVGREEVWARLEAAQRAGQAVFLAGAAGVGKTRLLRDFTRSLGSSLFNEARPGDVHSPYIVIARGIHRFLAAHPEVQLEPWEQLALARLLPQHSEDGAHAPGLIPSPLDTPGKHLRFTEAVASIFARIRRSVASMPADDIHYIDHASHVLMAQVFGRLVADERAGERAASLIVAYRPEETPPSFESLLAPLLESGAAVRIELEPLTIDAVGELVESLELPGGADLARRLHRYAGGNPMLTLETLKSMVSSGDLSAAPTLDLGFSQGAALIRRRLETLSSVALRVARAKAITQGDLNVHALAELIEMSPLAVAEGLEELQRAQVLSGEHFVHDLLYEAVLAGIPETLAQVLHERAALLLAQMPHKPERVAHHWLRAGDGAKAAPYLLQAALSARQIRADKEARHRYFQALWCLSGDSAPDKVLRRRALKGLGTLADLTHDFRLKAAVLGALEPTERPLMGGFAEGVASAANLEALNG